MILFGEKFISFGENVSWEVFCREAKIQISFLFLKKGKKVVVVSFTSLVRKENFCKKSLRGIKKKSYNAFDK